MAWNGAGQLEPERCGPEQLLPEQVQPEPATCDEEAGAACRSSAQALTASRIALTVGQRVRWTLGTMCGRSPAIERLFLQMRYLSNHLRVASIEGEPGTGKRLTASTLHQLRGPAAGSFVSCSATRFFTEGASVERLAQASGGTLYLSAADALEPELQGNLLHLVGWVQQQAVEARASLQQGHAAGEAGHVPRVLLVGFSRPLRPLMLYGKLRSDLYHQLAAVQLKLPPLRERPEDIAMLAEHFVLEFSEKYGKPVSGLAEETLGLLLHSTWPGNVRELRQSVDRAALRTANPWLGPRDFHLPHHPARSGTASQGHAVSSGIGGSKPQLGRDSSGNGSIAVRRPALGWSPSSAPAGSPGDPQRPSPGGLVPWPESDRALPRAEPSTMAACRQGNLHENGLKSGQAAGSARRPAIASATGSARVSGAASANAQANAQDVRSDSRAAIRPGTAPATRSHAHPGQGSLATMRSDYPARARTAESFLRTGMPESPGAARLTPLPRGAAAGGTSWSSHQAGDAQRTEQPRGRRPLELGDDAEASAHPESGSEPDWNLDRAILRHIRMVLGSVNGNKLRASRLLGISRSTLYRLLESAVALSPVPVSHQDPRGKAGSLGQ